MKNSVSIALLIAAFALLWVLSGVILPSGKAGAEGKDTAESSKALVQVRVRDSRAEDVVSQIVVTGRTQATRIVELRAEIEGQITEILAEKGAWVKEGDIIARLDERDRAARLSEARQRVNQREIEYNAAKALETKGFNSRIKLAEAQADLEAARTAQKQAEIDLANSAIKAPFAGALNDQMIEKGDYVAPGQSLYQLVDLNPIEVVGYITERQRALLDETGGAEIGFVDGSTVSGKISYVAAAADQQSRTFKIEISVPNPDYKIVDGLTAEISLPAQGRKAHKISPSILSLDDAGRIGVKQVDKNDTVRFAPVTILVDRPDAMWVEGLPDNVRLITVGQDFVADGQKVDPVVAEGDGLL